MSIKLKDTILDYIDKAYKDGSGNTISSTYLKLSGGTLTNSNVPLTINRTGATYSSISYQMDGTQIGVLGFDVNTGEGIISPNRTSNSTYYNLLHSGNSSVSGDGGSTWGSSITVKINGTSKTLTIPANPNTDTKVKQTVTTSNAEYPLLLAPSGQTATTTTSSYFDSGVTLNPSTNVISASISGNAATANKLGTSTLGGTYQPIYLSSGTATAGTSYAKAIKGITRSGLTFTYTCIDGTTGTFSQQDTVGTSYASSKSAKTAATAGWYRVATTAAGVNRVTGIFQIEGTVSGSHSICNLISGISYGNSAGAGVSVLSCHHHVGKSLTKARIVYNTTYSGNCAYLEVYLSAAKETTINVKLIDGTGWTLVNPNTAGSIPEGYSNKEAQLTDDSITTTGNLYLGGSLNISTLNIPTSSGGTTLGPGSSGQVLKSNGSTVYWAADSNSNTWRAIQANGTQIASTGTGTYALNFVSGTGITVAGTAGTSSAANKITITNAGVRSATINGNYLRVNTNGTNADLTIPYATLAGTLEYKNLPSSTTTTANTGWCKFATLTYNSRAWDSVQGYLFVSGVESNDSLGILYYHFRAGSTATTHSVSAFYWLIKNKDVTSVIAVKTADNVLDLYINNSGTYESIRLYHMSDMSGNFAWNVGTWTTTKPTVAFEATLVGRVNHSASADSVAWANVTGRPTITNYYWADQKITSSASYVTPSFTGVNIFESSSKTNRISINWNSTTGSASSIARIYAIDNAGSSYRDLSIGKTSGALYYDASADSWGIGTTTPSYKLHISGGLGATGAASLGSTLSVAGTTTLGGATVVKNSASNPYIYFQDSSVGNTMGTIYDFVSISDGAYTNSRFMFRQYSYTSGTTTRSSYHENYYLPQTAADLTASATYHILTTKNTAVSGDGGSTWGSSITVKINGTSKTLTIPANPNTDTKVTQTNSTGNADYRVLFSVTADDTTRTEGARKSTNLKFNPSTGTLTATTFSGALSGNATTATTASKLSTVSKTAWGQTYWTSGGIPTNISGDMTGVGNITISATSNRDYFINFLYNSTPTYSWRLGYLGSGSGNANYFVIDSSKSSGGTWHRVLQLGNETLEAVFSGSVTATSLIGPLNNTLTFAAGTFSATSYNNGSAVTVNIPTSKSHVGLGNVQNTAFYKRSTTVNGTAWDMAGTANSAAFTIYAPTTAGTSGYVLKSNGSGAPTWLAQSSIAAGSATYIPINSITAETSITETGLRAYSGGGSSWTGSVTSMAYAGIIALGTPSRGLQIWARRGTGTTGNLRFRVGSSDATAWETEREILDNVNSSVSLSGSTLTVKINGTEKSLTNTNTTYSAGTGISLSGTTFSNSGVRSIATGTSNGTISVNTGGTTANVAVKGLGSAAYTASTAYATASHTHDYAGKASITFTPANEELTAANVLSHTGGFSIAKGTWSYAGNGYIKAGSFGNIDLAGCSILTLGSGSIFTQLYITAPTQSGHSGLTNEMFFYNDHGSSYSPGWTRILTNRNYGSYCAAASHTHSYASKVTVGSTEYNVSSNNITIPAYPTTLKCPSSLTIQANGTSLGSYDGSSAKTFNITYSNVGAAAASHTHSYAGSSSAGGAASTVVCSAATSDNDRPIVGTNKSNQLYYTTKTTVNWSTGKITTPTINLNVAAGTAPISCTSTTVCTNLNAGLWDGYHLSVVSALPSSPGSTTIYFIT